MKGGAKLTPGAQLLSVKELSSQTPDLHSPSCLHNCMSRTVPLVTDGKVLGSKDWLGIDEGLVLGFVLGCSETLGLNDGI